VRPRRSVFPRPVAGVPAFLDIGIEQFLVVGKRCLDVSRGVVGEHLFIAALDAPSAGVVYSLANELGISLDFLFGEDVVTPEEPPRPPTSNRPWGRATGPDGAGIVQRAGDRNTIELSTGVRWERLTPVHDNTVDFIEVVYEPGGQSTENGRAIRHEGREYLYVLQGELEAVIGFETLRLTQGDSLAFDPATPHHYYNRTSGIVRVLSAVVQDSAT